MDIMNRRAYVLPMAIIFIIVTVTMSIGMYFSVANIYKVVGIKEVGRTKGYYACIAGLRYAAMLLQDPVTNFGFTDIDMNGETVTKYIMSWKPALATDLGLQYPRDVIITVTEQADGYYGVTASYTY